MPFPNEQREAGRRILISLAAFGLTPAWRNQNLLDYSTISARVWKKTLNFPLAISIAWQLFPNEKRPARRRGSRRPAATFRQVDCGIGTFHAGPFAKRSAVSWQELDGLPLVTLTRDSGIRLLVEIGYEAARIKLVPAYEVTWITTALAMVEASLGLGAFPTYVCRSAGAQHLRRAARTCRHPRHHTDHWNRADDCTCDVGLCALSPRLHQRFQHP